MRVEDRESRIIVQTSKTTDASFAIPLFYNGQYFLRAVDHAHHPAVVARSQIDLKSGHLIV